MPSPGSAMASAPWGNRVGAAGILMASAFLLLGPHASQAGEFPIGAWFPGLFNNQSGQFAARLDQVAAANFNTIHAALEPRNDASVNGVFMDLARRRGLEVQLYSWNVPPGWRTSRRYWTKTLEAENKGIFIHPVGVQDGDAWHVNTADHAPGIILDTPTERRAGIFLRYVEQQLNSRGRVVANRVRYGIHVFRLKTDDIRGPDRIATLRILRHSDGTLLRARDVRKLEFHSPGTYQDFLLRYPVPPGGGRVRYQIDWSGAGNLWVDEIRAHDDYGYRLFAGDFDRWIEDDLAAYDGDPVDPPWRFYVDDEPRWTEKDESVAYVNEIIKARTGKSGIVAFNQTRKDFMQHFVGTVSPAEFLVDFYTFGLYVPSPGQAGYAARLQDVLDSYVTWYGRGREVAMDAGIPLWAVIQAHDWPGVLRDPTPEEIRVQVYLALAHGVTGVYYFMYSSRLNNSQVAEIRGLVDGSYRITPKWTEVRDLNAMLQKQKDTLLQLTSDAVFSGNAPESFVQRLSDPADFHLGAFTHADGSRYLMVVNRRCRPSDPPRPVTIRLNLSRLNGLNYSYLVEDLHTGEMVATSNGFSAFFSVSLAPGEGRLFRLEPWDDLVTLSGDVTVPAGVKLTLSAGTTVEFAAGDGTGGGRDGARAELIVEGALDAGAGDITFRSSGAAEASSGGGWYGIRVGRGGSADLSGATIRDGHRCLQIHETSTVDVTNTTLIDCGRAVDLIPAAP